MYHKRAIGKNCHVSLSTFLCIIAIVLIAAWVSVDKCMVGRFYCWGAAVYWDRSRMQFQSLD